MYYGLEICKHQMKVIYLLQKKLTSTHYFIKLTNRKSQFKKNWLGAHVNYVDLEGKQLIVTLCNNQP